MPRGEPEYDLHYHWQLHLRARPAIWILPSLPGGSEGLVTRQEALLEFNRFQQRSTPLLRVREWLQRGCFYLRRQIAPNFAHQTASKHYESIREFSRSGCCDSCGAGIASPCRALRKRSRVLLHSGEMAGAVVFRSPDHALQDHQRTPRSPDGPYIVEVSGHIVSTYRLLGHFELSFVTFDIELHQAA